MPPDLSILKLYQAESNSSSMKPAWPERELTWSLLPTLQTLSADWLHWELPVSESTPTSWQPPLGQAEQSMGASRLRVGSSSAVYLTAGFCQYQVYCQDGRLETWYASPSFRQLRRYAKLKPKRPAEIPFPESAAYQLLIVPDIDTPVLMTFPDIKVLLRALQRAVRKADQLLALPDYRFYVFLGAPLEVFVDPQTTQVMIRQDGKPYRPRASELDGMLPLSDGAVVGEEPIVAAGESSSGGLPDDWADGFDVI